MLPNAFQIGLYEGARLSKQATLALRSGLGRALRPGFRRFRPAKPGIKTVPFRDVTPLNPARSATPLNPAGKTAPLELPAPGITAEAPAAAGINPLFAAIPAGALGFMAGAGSRPQYDPMAQMQQMMMMSQMMNQMGGPHGY